MVAVLRFVDLQQNLSATGAVSVALCTPNFFTKEFRKLFEIKGCSGRGRQIVHKSMKKIEMTA
jgi:hypothetical protein